MGKGLREGHLAPPALSWAEPSGLCSEVTWGGGGLCPRSRTPAKRQVRRRRHSGALPGGQQETAGESQAEGRGDGRGLGRRFASRGFWKDAAAGRTGRARGGGRETRRRGRDRGAGVGGRQGGQGGLQKGGVGDGVAPPAALQGGGWRQGWVWNWGSTQRRVGEGAHLASWVLKVFVFQDEGLRKTDQHKGDTKADAWAGVVLREQE